MSQEALAFAFGMHRAVAAGVQGARRSSVRRFLYMKMLYGIGEAFVFGCAASALINFFYGPGSTMR